ncbi:hypothetical protein OKW33_006450 [Paraburkholderia atlantica]|uniref:Transposase n=1 Tax=Paraburkholderia atlantica TaxID=2654982 RepID=A0A7W8QHP1_PARAM|nr:hypothetical protein [Paraburkholderia atlantica]MBB5429801.1 hypothetical protein [Paraburkholderia atlantica]
MKTTKSRGTGNAAQITVVQPHAAAIDIAAQFHVVAVGQERAPEPVRSFRSFTNSRGGSSRRKSPRMLRCK